MQPQTAFLIYHLFINNARGYFQDIATRHELTYIYMLMLFSPSCSNKNRMKTYVSPCRFSTLQILYVVSYVDVAYKLCVGAGVLELFEESVRSIVGFEAV